MIDITVIPAAFFALVAGLTTSEGSVAIETPAGRAEYRVEIAGDPLSQSLGLMSRASLPADTGMLFVYEQDRHVSFWMKNVTFPLDMIFIDRCGKVIQIHENAQPHGVTLIPSKAPVRAVLELRGGASKRDQIRIGDSVHLAGQIFDPC